MHKIILHYGCHCLDSLTGLLGDGRSLVMELNSHSLGYLREVRDKECPQVLCDKNGLDLLQGCESLLPILVGVGQMGENLIDQSFKFTTSLHDRRLDLL